MKNRLNHFFRFFACSMALLSFAAPAAQAPLDKIDHIIVIYLENHSFDNLFGTFPGASGLSELSEPQHDEHGNPYEYLPPVTHNGQRDTRFPDRLANAPFPIGKYAGYNASVPDPLHRFYQTQQQINHGRMEQFVRYSSTGAMVMGYYEETQSYLWEYARRYTLTDHFFTAAFGGSLLNHLWLICACAPRYENAPQSLKAVLDENGMMIRDGEISPDGYLINNIEPFSPPYNRNKAPSAEMRLPAQTLPTIGDQLSQRGIEWAWYSGGWNEAIKGNMGTFIPHHQPFLYFKNYGEGTEGREKHLRDEEDFLKAIRSGTLPAVVFYKPIGAVDAHPGYSAPQQSEEHVFAIVKAIENSALWKKSLIIVTFDDSGGFYDHVSPPKRDRFGPGIRIPTLLISPHVKKGFIDHTSYDSTSIIALIQKKFGLPPLNEGYKSAGDLSGALE